MRHAFEINPVFRRDSRVRWRGKASFSVLLLLAVAACGIVLWSYDANQGRQDLWKSGHGGRELFMALSYMQLCVWLLIVPSLSAPCIAFERECGLLEALQLSGMRPGHIVRGKLTAVMMFIAQLLLVTAPPLAVCFIMGGVDYDEFRGVLVLQIATIFLGASIGLYFSARARRSLLAVRNAYVTIFIWTIGFFLLLAALESVFGIGTVSRSPIFWLVILTHPAFVLQSVFDAGEFGRILARSGFTWPFDWTPLAVYSTLEFGIALFLLREASVYTGRVLPAVEWTRRKRGLILRRGRLQISQLEDAGQKSSGRGSAPVWEMPLTGWLRFRNPILQREVHSLLRFRPQSRGQAFVQFGGAIVLVLFYILLLFVVSFGDSFEVWNWVNNLLVWAVLSIAPMRGAYAIARERENGTWESLRLALLKPQEIVWGKALAPLLFSIGILAVLSPIGLLCVTQLLDERGSAIVPFPIALLTVVLLMSYVFCYTAWGIWISWRCRSSMNAVAWTIGPLFIWIFVINAFGRDWFQRQRTGYNGYGFEFMPDDLRLRFDLALFGNPFQEWNFLWQRARTGYNGYYYNWTSVSEWPGLVPGTLHAEAAIVALSLVGCLLLCDVIRGMNRRATLESEAKR